MTRIEHSAHELSVEFEPSGFVKIMAWVFTVLAALGVVIIAASVINGLRSGSFGASRIIESGISTFGAAVAAALLWRGVRRSRFAVDRDGGRYAFDVRPRLGKPRHLSGDLADLVRVELAGDINWISVVAHRQDGQKLTLSTLPRIRLGKERLWQLADALEEVTGHKAELSDSLMKWWKRPAA